MDPRVRGAEVRRCRTSRCFWLQAGSIGGSVRRAKATTAIVEPYAHMVAEVGALCCTARLAVTEPGRLRREGRRLRWNR